MKMEGCIGDAEDDDDDDDGCEGRDEDGDDDAGVFIMCWNFSRSWSQFLDDDNGDGILGWLCR